VMIIPPVHARRVNWKELKRPPGNIRRGLPGSKLRAFEMAPSAPAARSMRCDHLRVRMAPLSFNPYFSEGSGGALSGERRKCVACSNE
jgi:hypothetical protein